LTLAREHLPPDRQKLVGDERVPASGLYAPLISNDRVIGVLNVQSYERNAYDEIDLTLLAILANQAAAALVNARLYEQAQQEVVERTRTEVALQNALEMLRERIKELTVLTKVSGMLHERNIDSDVLWQTVVNVLPDAFQFSELAGARIRIGDREWTSPNFVDSKWRLQTEIDVPEGPSATMEVAYHTKPLVPSEDIFLTEEHDFLRTLSEMLRIYFERHHAEAASRYNEMLLRRVLETLPVGVWISDQEHNTLRSNPAALSIWGLKKPFETLQTSFLRGWWSSTGRPVLPDEWASERAHRTGNAVLDDEIEIEAFDGKRKVISNSAVPIRDDTGRAIGQIIVNQDITDRKRRERQLAAIAIVADAVRTVETRAQVVPVALERIDTLVNATGTAIIIRSGPDQVPQVEYATGEFSPLTGARITSNTSVCHTVMAKGQPVVIQDARSYREELWKPYIHVTEAAVCVPLRVQGEVTGVMVVGQNRRIDPDGVYLVSALADIVAGAAHRATLYAQVQSQAQRLARVMETAPSGIFVLDSEMRIVLQNERALRYLELMKSVSPENRITHLAGIPIGEFLAHRDANAPAHEIEISTPEHRIFEVDAGPVASGGDSTETEWVILLRDVTREREIQQRIQQHDRLAAIGQLAAGIAHDFNNIAAVIVLYSQLLQRSENLTEGEQKRISVIREQAQHASYLIRQILDFSRQSVLERRPLDLADFVRNVSVLLSHTLPETIHIVNEVVDPGEYIVAADATRLQQVAMNLAFNGRDAMPQGGTLTIRLGRVRVRPGTTPLPEMQPGLWFWLSFEDTGTGIPSEHLPRIFDPFFSTKGPGKGTGLGLAQVYGIVRQHDGYVGVSSQVGKGTTITVYLPAWHEASAAVEEDVSSLVAEPHGRGEIILVVEDSPPAREATQAILEMQGYRVLAAANGEEGLEIFRKYGSAIDLVLSDLVMPVMGGIELYRTLQASHTDLRFMIMTGYPLEDGGKELLEQGIVAWIQKPFSIAELTRKVNSVLHRS
jgi:two-component system cell cycle sensor histidine kinase/response regulator CckA